MARALIRVKNDVAIKLAGETNLRSRYLPRHKGRRTMADERMKNDDLKQQAGQKRDDRDIEQKSPGRNPQDDQSTGQRSGQSLDNEDIDDGKGSGQGNKGSHGEMGR